METKRLAIAIALSCGIFLGWNFLARHMGWVPEAPVVSVHNATQAAAPQALPAESQPEAIVDIDAPQQPVFTPVAGHATTVETPLYKAVFHSDGGVLQQFYLKKYRTDLPPDSPLVNMISDAAFGQAPLGLLLNGQPSWANVSWSLEGKDMVLGADDTGVLRFSAEVDGVRLVREMSFSGSAYTINEKVRLSSATPRNVNLGFSFKSGSLAVDKRPSIFGRIRYGLFGGEEPVASENQYNMTRVAWLQNDKFSEEGGEGDLRKGEFVNGKVSWMAVMNNYFMGAVSMSGADASAKGSLSGDVYRVLVGKSSIPVSAMETEVDCSYFIGPKEATQLSSTPNDMQKALDYGFFSVIAKPLVYLLQFFYKYVNNYGVAIILMTVLIKALFWPLSQKSYKSMQQMKQLQPMMAKIREKYAGDKEALNREIMQLYKTYKVNPAGGCLPILIQIPVFFGLYQALLNAIELRHAPFVATLPFSDKVWLADLASPDPYLITPLVMGATMFLQQKMTPTPGDPTQAKVMLFMPVILTALFINFPSGLVVYWLVNNVISIGQQWLQLRRSS